MSKTNTKQTETLAQAACEIPLGQLVPSKSNVRRFYATASIQALAADILAHRLLQNLVVKAERDEAGSETGKFEVTAGGRRLAALRLLARRKKIAKDAPIPCNLREDGIAEELSLAENIQREALDPADEFEAFHDLHVNKGQSAEAIAVRFGTTTRHVQQRLKLGAVSPTLIDLYRAGEMTLEQLMAFTVSDDPIRQEEVWVGLSWNKTPAHIRECLLASHVPASDKRARFVGVAAYEAAGGTVLRDLFSQEDDGYLADGALLDRLAISKLEIAAEAVRAEGWKWVEIAVDFPHAHGFARFYEREVPLSETDAEKIAKLEAQIAECDRTLEENETDEALTAKLHGLEAKLVAFDAKRYVFDLDAMAQGGAFVVIGHDGEAEIVRGVIRPEDRQEAASDEADGASQETQNGHGGGEAKSDLSEKLIANLTAQRTMALRDMLAKNADVALAALTHALILQRFYHGARGETCLDLTARHDELTSLAENIEESVAGRAIAARHEAWARRLPQEPEAAWAFVQALTAEDRNSLLAHCVALSVDATARAGRIGPEKAAAGQLANALSLDMAAYWQATAGSYFGRVSKVKIVEAVTEAGLPDEARRMADFKKVDMAETAEELLADRKWLPEILRAHMPDNVSTQVMAQAAE